MIGKDYLNDGQNIKVRLPTSGMDRAIKISYRCSCNGSNSSAIKKDAILEVGLLYRKNLNQTPYQIMQGRSIPEGMNPDFSQQRPLSPAVRVNFVRFANDQGNLYFEVLSPEKNSWFNAFELGVLVKHFGRSDGLRKFGH